MGDFERRAEAQDREREAAALRERQKAAQAQAVEFGAAAKFVEAFEQLAKTPAIDEALEMRKADYVSALLGLLKAATANGRGA